MTNPFDSLLHLFHAELSAVQFPGVDAKVLDAAAVQIASATDEVRRAEQALDAARTALTAAQEDALGKAQRALAYARIYAQDDPTLLARLDAVAMAHAPASSATVAPRKRGRPPKSAVTPLFAEPAAEVEQRADA